MSRNVKVFTVYSLLVMVCLVISPASEVWGTKKVSAPFQYSGYTYPEYTGFTRSSEYVEMSDGLKLAVTCYLPSEGPTSGPFPTIFTYLPYKRENIDPNTGDFLTLFDKKVVEFFTSYGYAWVFADMRGSGVSDDTRIDFSPPIPSDGKELVDWIANQDWSDKNVGMSGGSYDAWSQFATAAQKPVALKCIMPESAHFFDLYSGASYNPGGIYNQGLWDVIDGFMTVNDLNYYIPVAGIFPSAPVIDEDGDGDLADEIPVDQNNNGTFLDDYMLPDNPPQYKDGKKRQHIYYEKTLRHISNKRFMKMPKEVVFTDTYGNGGRTFSDLTIAQNPDGIAESGIAIYNNGGWFDLFLRDTTMWYSTFESSNPSKMFIAPNNHSGPGFLPMDHGPYWEYFGEDIDEVRKGYNLERLRFFDHYLKGIQNGIDKEPPVYIYVMNGEGWRFENEWPLDRQITASLYFGKDNSLSLIRKDEGSDDYTADFTHDSRQVSSGGNRWNIMPQDQVDIRTEKDLQCLTYTSAPFKWDAEVTGHPVVHFWVSSTADYGDFFVYLEDVDENGEAYFITDGMLRAGFAGLVPNEEILPPGSDIDILPDFPWHGFSKADYVDGIFTGGNVVELVIDFMPTSWVFKEGHRVRVSIACADYPTFPLHPKLSPKNDLTDSNNIIPTITVHRNAKHQSRIELPVIPKKKLQDTKALNKWIEKRFNP